MQEHAKALQASHLGLSFLVAVGGGLYLGYLADRSLGTTPLLMLLGVAAGFGAGFYHLYYVIFARPKWVQEHSALSESDASAETTTSGPDPSQETRSESNSREAPSLGSLQEPPEDLSQGLEEDPAKGFSEEESEQ